MNPLDLFQHETNLLNFSQGDEIFHQGEAGNCMYIIKEGEVSLNIGNQTEYIAVTGDIFGELSMIDLEPRSATAIAESDCQLIPVDQKQFTFMVQQTPYFSIHVMQVLAERLRYMNENLT